MHPVRKAALRDVLAAMAGRTRGLGDGGSGAAEEKQPAGVVAGAVVGVDDGAGAGARAVNVNTVVGVAQSTPSTTSTAPEPSTSANCCTAMLAFVESSGDAVDVFSHSCTEPGPCSFFADINVVYRGMVEEGYHGRSVLYSCQDASHWWQCVLQFLAC
jgi:hypothetical protein